MTEEAHLTTLAMGTAGILGVGFLLGNAPVRIIAGGIGWAATAWVMWSCARQMRGRPGLAPEAARVLAFTAPLNLMSAGLVLWGVMGFA